MTGYVAVVTDSTACVPHHLAAQWGITVVQQQLRIGDHYDDEARVPGRALTKALRDRIPVTTSPPDPAAFFWAYQGAMASGARAVVSIHVSGKLSKTADIAREAARQASIPVHVLDSGMIGMSLGYGVLAAARVAAAGGDVRPALGLAATRLANSHEMLHVQTLEYLRRGGRIGAAQHLIGSALSVKPLLTVKDGQIAPLERTIGADRAVRKLVDRVVTAAGTGPVDLAVEYVEADERAPWIADQLKERVPGVRELMSVEVSSIISAHVGPGAIGVSISPAG